MPRLSKKFRQEWAFFIHPKTGRVKYNKLCARCEHEECKQSYKVKIIVCPHFKLRSEKTK